MRSDRQIDSAKRAQTRRLGQSGAAGMRKRCKKGKSCGASCISSYKFCMVDLPWASASQIPKVVSLIQSRKTPELDNKVKPERETRETTKLDKLETADDFINKRAETEGEYSPAIEAMHSWVSKLFGREIQGWEAKEPSSENEKKFFEKLRDKFLKSIGEGGDPANGVSVAKEMLEAVKMFTGSYSDYIRKVQRGEAVNFDKDKYLKYANRIEQLLRSKQVDKPDVEKFRGMRVNDEALTGMVTSARAKGNFPGMALASWSTSLGVSQDFADREQYNGKNNRVIIRTINSKGAPIAAISGIGYEMEVLTSGEAKYKYLNYRTIKTREIYGADTVTYHVFDVEES